MIKTDILVVGLGPAGASAATAAAEAGCSVIALDRKKSAGLPVQCAEFVPAMIGQEVSQMVPTRRQKIEAMVTFVEDEPADVKEDFPGHMIDRAEFDQLLVAQAEAAGVDCRFGVHIAEVRPDGLVVAANGDEFRARIIIGADGPRSPVGTAIGSPNDELVETRQITVPLLKPHQATDIFLSAKIAGGYGWLFPKGDVANLGLGVDPAFKHQLKPLLEELHTMLVHEERVGEAILSHTGGLIPVGGLRQAIGQLGDVMVILAGDAAGLTNPVTGAGINAAVISGGLAGEAAASYLAGGGDAMEDYSDELDELFAASVGRGVARRHELMAKFQTGNPSSADLRAGWIAYPHYWRPVTTTTGARPHLEGVHR